MMEYRRTHNGGNGHKTALDSSVWRSSVFLRLHGPFLRGNKPGDYTKTALGEDFSGPFVISILLGRFRFEINLIDPARSDVFS